MEMGNKEGTGGFFGRTGIRNGIEAFGTLIKLVSKMMGGTQCPYPARRRKAPRKESTFNQRHFSSVMSFP